MALSFGWRLGVTVESIWWQDPALMVKRPLQDVDDGDSVMVCAAPEAALKEWWGDFDASHLRPYCKGGQPTIIELRQLTADEAQAVLSFYHDAANREEAWARACLLAFRIGASFPGLESVPDPRGGGDRRGITVKERGIRMLAEPFVAHLAQTYRGIVSAYGGHILNASILTEAEKKASSPLSTSTASSEAATSTPATTEPSPSVPDA